MRNQKRSTMEFKLSDRMEKALAVVFFIVLGVLSYTAASAQHDRVIIKGRIFVPTADLPTACLTASDGATMDMVIRPNGEFWVNAPIADRYAMEFVSAGCVPKSVEIDGRNAGRSRDRPRTRMVEFDVVLHAEGATRPMRYEGPVGGILLHSSNGRMEVTRHYRMVPVQVIEGPVAMSTDRRE